jgi:hypothetical protein
LVAPDVSFQGEEYLKQTAELLRRIVFDSA